MPNTNYILTPEGNFISETELYHHGIKGQKWGVRRYQNEDGSLTAAGKKRNKKLIEDFTVDDAVKTGTRFIGGVTIETIGHVAATLTGKEWIGKLGRAANTGISIYNAFVLSNKILTPMINKRKTRSISNGIANNNQQQLQIQQFMNRGAEFANQCLQQNNVVATNQIMGFY